LSTLKVDQDKSSFSLTTSDGTQDHKYGDFFNAGDAGGSAQGEVVFVGYGISSPKQGHDDYAGLDVKGKIVLFVRGTPQGIDPSLLADNETEDDAAQAHGASAVIALPSAYAVSIMKNPRYREYGLERVRLTKALGSNIAAVVPTPEICDQLLKPV